jgi:hypothetical protein
MSSPSESDQGSNWAELAPNLREQEEAITAVARQVRILFAAGKDTSEVCAWLQEIGLTNEQAKAFLSAHAEAERSTSHGESAVTSGPWDFGGVFAPRDDPLQKRRERRERQQKSRRLEAEPDPTLDLGSASYAEVLARESRHGERGARLFTLLAVAAVSVPILAIIVYVVLSGLGLL